MARVTLDRAADGRVRGWLIHTEYHERGALRAAGARWDSARKCWRLPLDMTDRLHDLAGMTALEADPDAVAYARREEARQEALAALRRTGDAGVSHGEGLAPYQRVGVRFLADAGRAVLADDMGLGKTAQAVRAALEVGARRVLVVTKKSLIVNWLREIGRWAANGKCAGEGETTA